MKPLSGWWVSSFCHVLDCHRLLEIRCQSFVLSSRGMILIKQGFVVIQASDLCFRLCRCLIRRTSDILSKYLPVKIEQVVCCRYWKAYALPGRVGEQQKGLKSCKKPWRLCLWWLLPSRNKIAICCFACWSRDRQPTAGGFARWLACFGQLCGAESWAMPSICEFLSQLWAERSAIHHQYWRQF